MKHAIRAAALLTAFFVTTSPANAQNPGIEEGQWYVSPMATFMREDVDRNTNNGIGGHFGVGRGLGGGWAVELNAVGVQTDGLDELGQWGVGIDALHSFWPRGRITPYYAFGVGYLKSQINDDPSLVVPVTERFDEDNPFAHVAGGFMSQLGDNGMQLRGEVRYRADLRDPEDYRDLLFNLGVVIPFGSPRQAPTYDSDSDGVIDGADQCPGTAAGAAVDSRGCELDGDSDGVPDSRDACPDTRPGARVDGKGCEVDSDSDRDGVPNKQDRCPNTPRGTKVDAYGCKTIEDSDGDGVLDNRDRCPNTASGARVDVNGCEFKEEIQLRGVTFESNSATLTQSSLGILNDAAATLKRNSDLRVEAQGHTDSQGPDSYNLALSQRRAETVRDYLIREGVSADTLTAKGYGESQPVADNSTAAGRAENRRVVLKVIGE